VGVAHLLHGTVKDRYCGSHQLSLELVFMHTAMQCATECECNMGGEHAMGVGGACVRVCVQVNWTCIASTSAIESNLHAYARL
jgi:hypothetical protein